MQLKKLLQGSAFALVAAACAIAVPSVAKAATGDLAGAGLGDVTVDGSKAEMTVKFSSGVQEVLVGIGKVNKSNVITVSSWDTYETKDKTDGVKVDLSKLSNTKDNYIVLTTPAKDISIVKIPQANKKAKAKFDAGKGQIQFDANGSPANVTDKDVAKKIEYKTAYGNWTNMATSNGVVDFSLYQEEGAKLTVRAVASGRKDDGTFDKLGTQTDTKLKYGVKGSETEYPIYEASSLPGKEVKVSIPAKAKGPKATADYVKGTVKFPKNSEYRLVKPDKIEAASADGKYTAGTTTATTIAEIVKNKSDFSADTVTEFDIEVRTAATDKKAASKWSRLSVTKPAALASGLLTAGSDKKTDGKVPDATDQEQTYTGKGVVAAIVKESTENTATKVLDIKYVASKLPKDSKLTENAVEIKNNGEFDYEVVVGDKSATSAPTDKKATKIAKGKTVTLKVEDQSTVWIRKAGNKKDLVWVGAYAQLGVVDYGYKVAAKPTESKS